jgi:hypothetical protein
MERAAARERAGDAIRAAEIAIFVEAALLIMTAAIGLSGIVFLKGVASRQQKIPFLPVPGRHHPTAFGLSMVAPGASCGTAMETPERKPPELPQLWATVAPN